MLRGAIDYFDGVRIGGWIYSDVAPVRDAAALAFVDGTCVGAGQIESFRKDLADAGLGDGHVGFNFIVSLPPGTEPERVYVKLENSDFALLNRSARIGNAGSGSGGATASGATLRYDLDQIEWMRGRGWLDAVGFDFLKRTTLLGLFDHALRGLGGEMLDPKAEAHRLLEIYAQREVAVQTALIEVGNIGDERENLVRGAAVPLVAVHAPKGALFLVEGSHADEGAGGRGLAGAMRHNLRPDRLLVLDGRATVASEGQETATVFRAIPAEDGGAS